MYFVDREKIEATLVYIEKNIALFNEAKNWETALEMLALERIVHTMIESVLDVGNRMIDGFIMRDPGSYEDIVDILLDESVVTNEEATQLKEVIRLRKMLVQQYDAVEHALILNTWRKNISAFVKFPTSIRTYLEHELGPVSAFLPEKNN